MQVLILTLEKQECIPVGCVPTASVAISWGGGVSWGGGGGGLCPDTLQVDTPSIRPPPPLNRMTHTCENINFHATWSVIIDV